MLDPPDRAYEKTMRHLYGDNPRDGTNPDHPMYERWKTMNDTGVDPGPNDEDSETEQGSSALPPITGELSALRKHIAETVAAIDTFKGQRKSVNTDIEAKVAELETHGINRHALKFVMFYIGLDEKQRANFDDTMVIVREAMGQPMQGDLFKRPPLAAVEDEKAA